MSTTASIAMLTKSNGVKYSTVHLDGYLDGVGKILVDHYSDFTKAEKLINLGDLSSLGTTYETSDVIKRFGFGYLGNPKYLALPKKEQERLAKESCSTKYTTAYHRDRGEELSLRKFSSIPAYLNRLKDNGEEFNYFLGSNDKHEPQWYVVDRTAFKPLIFDASDINHERCFLVDLPYYNIADYEVDFSTEQMQKYRDKAKDQKIKQIENYISELQQKYSLGSEKPSVTNIGFQYGGWGETVVVHLTQPNDKQYLGLHVPLYLIKDGKGFERQILKQLIDSLVENAPKGIEDTPLYKILDKEYRDYVMRDTENILEQASRFAYVG